MADNSYPIEVRLCSKNGYHTPAEARAYYGRYGRDGITVHWWGGGEPASAHDSIVNYIYNGSVQGVKSVNYVLSDNKITLMVPPDDVAWASQAGNPTTISVETQPTLGAEGYKKWGWLVNQLEQRYGKKLPLYPHNYWFSTQCPGTLSLDRIRQETDKWARGEYDGAPTPAPTPPANGDIEWHEFAEGTRKFVITKNTNLWAFNSDTWAGITAVKPFNQGDEVDIKGYAVNRTLKATYLLTPFSFDKKIANGFNIVDLTLKQQPAPAPDPVPAPTPPPSTPEWEKNLRDIDDTKFWVKEDTDLINITTGQAATVPAAKKFKKNDEFTASALTVVGGVEYRLTQYSFDKKIYNGLPTDKLTLTPPGVPDVPPEQTPVPDPTPDKGAIIAFLEGLVASIVAFIKKLKGEK